MHFSVKTFFLFHGIALLILFMPTRVQSQILGWTPDQLDDRIRKAESRFEFVQADVKTRIPPSILSHCIGIIIIQQFKAGIGIGAQGGNGIAMVRNAKTRHWSPPAFVANAEGSYGWQIGAQNAQTVFCIMHPEGLKILTQEGLKLGIDVRATAGPDSTGGQANFDRIKTPILVYSTQEGLFAGIAFEGGGILPAERKNMALYGMNMQEVLFSGRARWTKAGADLVRKVEAFAQPQTRPGFNLGQPQIR